MTPEEIAEYLAHGDPIRECSPWSEAWREIMRHTSQLECFEYFKRVVQRLVTIEKERDRDEASDIKHAAGEILATIHGDGGHYIEKHGWEQAGVDGIAKFYRLLVAFEAYRDHTALTCVTPGCMIGKVCDPCMRIIQAKDDLKTDGR